MKKIIIFTILTFLFVGCTNLGTKVICENGECQVEEKGN